jgi:hypothetical protein
MNPDWVPPAYLSPSQISSLTTCGEQYRLTRVEGAPERPMWAGIGGSTVHKVTELLDEKPIDNPDIETLFAEIFQQCLDEAKERHPEFDPSEYYRSGRASKEWPEKEGPEWWAKKGPGFVRAWLAWRQGIDLELWEVPDDDGELHPAVEVEVNASIQQPPGDDLRVRSIIDRIFIDPNGDLRIVDIKTGSHTDAWPRQMAYNALGVWHTFGERVRWAGFWSARKGGVQEWTDLTRYSDDWLWSQAQKAKAIRDNQLFLAAPTNLCTSACGVRQFCVAMGGTPFFRRNATVTQATVAQEEG